MIRGVGIDLCDVVRLTRALDGEAGERFRARVFTAQERAYCDGRGRGRAESYAARFAAKEAVAKALGTGIGAEVSWQDVEVLRDGDGRPALRLHAGAARLGVAHGVTRWHLSLSHAGGVAVAMVVAEGDVRAPMPSDDESAAR